MFVASRLGLSSLDFDVERYSRPTRSRHQRAILNFYGFGSFDRRAEALLVDEIAKMARTHLKPKLIFERCLDYLVQSRVQVPSSHRLTDLIRDGLNKRKRHLIGQIDGSLDRATQQTLDDLFDQEDDENRYRLTLLKRQSQSTRPAKVKESSADSRVMSELFEQLLPTLDKLDLDPDGIRYFAGSVLRSEVFQIARRADPDRYLHVIAFVAHQHYRSQDRLVDMLLNSVQSFQSAAERDQKERIFEQRKDHDDRIDRLLATIDHELLGALSGCLGSASRLRRLHVERF